MTPPTSTATGAASASSPRSERSSATSIFVATKAGRRRPQQTRSTTRPRTSSAGPTEAGRTCRWRRSTSSSSTARLRTCSTIPRSSHALDDLVAPGAIAHYGVSVERVEEGLKALDFPGVASVQIIYNIFRQRPGDRFLAAAKAADVGVIVARAARLGSVDGQDHSGDNLRRRRPPQLQPPRRGLRRRRDLRGVNLETGLEVVDELRPLVAPGESLAAFALRYCLSDPGVSTVIPGAKNPEQARQNSAAGELGPLDQKTIERLGRSTASASPLRSTPLVISRAGGCSRGGIAEGGDRAQHGSTVTDYFGQARAVRLGCRVARQHVAQPVQDPGELHRHDDLRGGRRADLL